ncbi:tRNA(Ile2) 2-agmatinylcytidine synthetase [Halobacteriales archaeon SW_12_71_31]|nr:MAG: tRNA(Ile2) 2-agmatinylcytidine synthetase [Halobacteriales archaeon SW_12_71_31]
MRCVPRSQSDADDPALGARTDRRALAVPAHSPVRDGRRHRRHGLHGGHVHHLRRPPDRRATPAGVCRGRGRGRPRPRRASFGRPATPARPAQPRRRVQDPRQRRPGARRVVRDLVPPEAARERVADAGYAHETWGSGRGLVGALAAVGAWRGRGPAADWTYERIAYREAARRGTAREVDRDAVFAAADRGYPTVWDTVDRETGETVCVPHTPGPVLFGVRGDDPEAVREVAAAVDSEPVAAAETFVTNQGTDDHLRSGSVADVEAGRSYRLDGVVVDAPETREGGHVFLTVASPDRAPAASGVDADEADESETSPAVARWALAVTADDLPADARLPCVAFEPTGRFRNRVRDLREGDRVTVCGEVSDGTLKLEKFALRSRRTVEPVVPTCPACGRSMESAGADQGYRCRDCDTSASGRTTRRVERPAPGWYEVPPTARRHVAKPLVRGGFDAPTRPER